MANGPNNADQTIDVKTEYQCAAAFHGDLIKSRFTVAGLYVAASAVVIGKVAELSALDQPKPVVVVVTSGFMAFLSIVCLGLDWRTRFLYRAVATRLACLEEDLAKIALPGKKPFFHYCYELDEGKETRDFSRWKCTHSWCFDCLYRVGLSAWTVCAAVNVASYAAAVCQSLVPDAAFIGGSIGLCFVLDNVFGRYDNKSVGCNRCRGE